MLPLLFGIIRSYPTEECAQASGTDCTNCMSVRGNYKCGWCSSTKQCVPGDENGPFIGTCPDWHNESDAVCVKESSIALPNPARIGVLVGIIIVNTITFVFWYFIFPKLYTDPAASSEKNGNGL